MDKKINKKINDKSLSGLSHRGASFRADWGLLAQGHPSQNALWEGHLDRAADIQTQTRPRGSRLGAWASAQSAVIPNRDVLSAALAEAETRFPGDVPPPPEWGGYRLAPERIEFWQGRTNRLHDRLRYRQKNSRWIIERLAP